jgi:hypothetical protein
MGRSGDFHQRCPPLKRSWSPVVCQNTNMVPRSNSSKATIIQHKVHQNVLTGLVVLRTALTTEYERAGNHFATILFRRRLWYSVTLPWRPLMINLCYVVGYGSLRFPQSCLLAGKVYFVHITNTNITTRMMWRQRLNSPLRLPPRRKGEGRRRGKWGWNGGSEVATTY